MIITVGPEWTEIWTPADGPTRLVRESGDLRVVVAASRPAEKDIGEIWGFGFASPLEIDLSEDGRSVWVRALSAQAWIMSLMEPAP